MMYATRHAYGLVGSQFIVRTLHRTCMDWSQDKRIMHRSQAKAIVFPGRNSDSDIQTFISDGDDTTIDGHTGLQIGEGTVRGHGLASLATYHWWMDRTSPPNELQQIGEGTVLWVGSTQHACNSANGWFGFGRWWLFCLCFSTLEWRQSKCVNLLGTICNLWWDDPLISRYGWCFPVTIDRGGH